MSDSPSDDRRLEELLERYGGLLAATIRRACPRDLGIDTQDIEQDARLRLWRALSRATEEGLGASYVRKVAATAAIDAIRAALARRDRKALADLGSVDEDGEIGPELQSADATPEELARRRQVSESIASAIDALSPARRRAVRLHLFGLSSPEISGLTGWSGTKARSLISRGLAEVRRTLAEKGVDRYGGT